MLRTALRSVAAQTALRAIKEVVVIENLGNRESETVCQEFPQLPIRYFFRDPPIPPGFEATCDAQSRIRCERMAILFDDDWWMPEHLESAIESLESRADAVAACCAYLATTGEDGYCMGVGNSLIPWFAASLPPVNHRWVFKLPDLLVANQISVGFSYMTALVKTEIWTKCLECVSHGNPFDTDRLMFVEMGRHGTVIADSRPHVYVRRHPGQEEQRLVTSGEGARWWMDSTNRLLALAESEGVNLCHEFATRMAAKAIDEQTLRGWCCFNNIDYLIKKDIIRPTNNLPGAKPVGQSNWRKLYHGLTPPFMQNWVSAIRHRKSSGAIVRKTGG
jgi:hypothetical protein